MGTCRGFDGRLGCGRSQPPPTASAAAQPHAWRTAGLLLRAQARRKCAPSWGPRGRGARGPGVSASAAGPRAAPGSVASQCQSQAAVRTRGLGSPVAVWAGGGAPPSSSPQASACTGTWTRFCQRVPWKPEPSSSPGFSQTFTLTPECTAGGGPRLPAAHSGCTGTGRRGFEGSSGSCPVSLPRQAPRGALPAAVTCSSCPGSPSRPTGAR